MVSSLYGPRLSIPPPPAERTFFVHAYEIKGYRSVSDCKVHDFRYTPPLQCVLGELAILSGEPVGLGRSVPRDFPRQQKGHPAGWPVMLALVHSWRGYLPATHHPVKLSLRPCSRAPCLLHWHRHPFARHLIPHPGLVSIQHTHNIACIGLVLRCWRQRRRKKERKNHDPYTTTRSIKP